MVQRKLFQGMQRARKTKRIFMRRRTRKRIRRIRKEGRECQLSVLGSGIRKETLCHL
jgi:hypothetical protein